MSTPFREAPGWTVCSGVVRTPQTTERRSPDRDCFCGTRASLSAGPRSGSGRTVGRGYPEGRAEKQRRSRAAADSRGRCAKAPTSAARGPKPVAPSFREVASPSDPSDGPEHAVRCCRVSAASLLAAYHAPRACMRLSTRVESSGRRPSVLEGLPHTLVFSTPSRCRLQHHRFRPPARIPDGPDSARVSGESRHGARVVLVDQAIRRPAVRCWSPSGWPLAPPRRSASRGLRASDGGPRFSHGSFVCRDAPPPTVAIAGRRPTSPRSRCTRASHILLPAIGRSAVEFRCRGTRPSQAASQHGVPAAPRSPGGAKAWIATRTAARWIPGLDQPHRPFVIRGPAHAGLMPLQRARIFSSSRRRSERTGAPSSGTGPGSGERHLQASASRSWCAGCERDDAEHGEVAPQPDRLRALANQQVHGDGTACLGHCSSPRLSSATKRIVGREDASHDRRRRSVVAGASRTA